MKMLQSQYNYNLNLIENDKIHNYDYNVSCLNENSHYLRKIDTNLNLRKPIIAGIVILQLLSCTNTSSVTYNTYTSNKTSYKLIKNYENGNDNNTIGTKIIRVLDGSYNDLSLIHI